MWVKISTMGQESTDTDIWNNCDMHHFINLKAISSNMVVASGQALGFFKTPQVTQMEPRLRSSAPQGERWESGLQGN